MRDVERYLCFVVLMSAVYNLLQCLPWLNVVMRNHVLLTLCLIGTGCTVKLPAWKQ